MSSSTRQVAHVTLDGHGRVVIPAEFRRELGIDEGDRLTLVLEDGALTILTKRAAVRRVQETVAQYGTPGRSLADELIAERRAEAERESRD